LLHFLSSALKKERKRACFLQIVFSIFLVALRVEGHMMLLLFALALVVGSVAPLEPLSVHASFFNDISGRSRLILGWITIGPCPSVVRYGSTQFSLPHNATTNERATRYDKDAGFNHFVVLPELSDKVVFYQVGDGKTWSTRVFSVRNPAVITTSFKAWVCGGEDSIIIIFLSQCVDFVNCRFWD
jgi:hypothetical protein